MSSGICREKSSLLAVRLSVALHRDAAGRSLALTYGDIDRKAGVIHVTKKLSYATGQVPVLEDHLKSENGRRDIPLLPPLAAALPRNRAGLIFPGEDGGFMRSSEITKNWRRYCRDAGLFAAERASNGETVETFHITPHCFRHSMATICYEAGLDPRQTARILGGCGGDCGGGLHPP